MKKKNIGVTLQTVVTLLFTATPFIVSASSISADNQTLKTCTEQSSTVVYMNNERFLNNLKAQNPEAYNKIPETVKSEAIYAGLLRQGTTKIVRTSNGFKIYLNSAIVKTIKYTGIGAAGITATTGGIGSPAFVGVGAVIGYIANEVNASRGIVVTFSKKESLVSWKQQ